LADSSVYSTLYINAIVYTEVSVGFKKMVSGLLPILTSKFFCRPLRKIVTLAVSPTPSPATNAVRPRLLKWIDDFAADRQEAALNYWYEIHKGIQESLREF
jgi:hypothetical protein